MLGSPPTLAWYGRRRDETNDRLFVWLDGTASKPRLHRLSTGWRGSARASRLRTVVDETRWPLLRQGDCKWHVRRRRPWQRRGPHKLTSSRGRSRQYNASPLDKNLVDSLRACMMTVAAASICTWCRYAGILGGKGQAVLNSEGGSERRPSGDHVRPSQTPARPKTERRSSPDMSWGPTTNQTVPTERRNIQSRGRGFQAAVFPSQPPGARSPFLSIRIPAMHPIPSLVFPVFPPSCCTDRPQT